MTFRLKTRDILNLLIWPASGTGYVPRPFVFRTVVV
jgi:hypothetical protein